MVRSNGTPQRQAWRARTIILGTMSSIGNCRQRALEDEDDRTRDHVEKGYGHTAKEWFDPDPGAGTANASDPISSSERARRPRTNDSSAPPSKFFLSSRRRQRLTWSHEIRAEFVAAGQLDALSSAKVSAMASHIVCKLQRKLEYMYELLMMQLLATACLLLKQSRSELLAVFRSNAKKFCDGILLIWITK